ncbi:MAG: exonuclease SbcCD subunit D [Nanoarchaeota archaeon]|nr:exonuclease SbcCD subunit D [Nanoarchaeota archaeon]
MRYAHLADLHLGSWREPKMRDLSTKAFLTAIDDCLQRNVDFILFAGDFFNTSLPGVDTLKIVAKKLKELQEKSLPLYCIAGSHDFSPSGKTMLDVLEEGGLLVNVCKGSVDPQTKKLHLSFTVDKKTGAKITGILGRRGLLDKAYYENLDLESLENEPAYKIFLFHTTLTELKPKHLEHLESQPVSFLPKGFDYYAGGHVHHPTKIEQPGYGTLTYTGALFPNSFAEVEKYGKGGYFIVDVPSEGKSEKERASLESSQQKVAQQVAWIPLEVVKHLPLILSCDGKSPDVISFEMLNYFENKEIKDALLTIRLTGKLGSGKISDIKFRDVFQQLLERGAYSILKNTSQLQAESFEEIKIKADNPETIEEELIKEHLQQMKTFDRETELQLTKSLLGVLNTSKKEGETVMDFQGRVESEMDKILHN